MTDTWESTAAVAEEWVSSLNPATTFTTVYREATDGGGGAVDSVNSQTGVVVLDSDDVAGPIQMFVRVATPVANLGGTVGGGTATIAALDSVPTGEGLWLQSQTDPGDDGFYLKTATNTFTETTNYLSGTDHIARLIVVGIDLGEGNAPTVYVISAPSGTPIATRIRALPDYSDKVNGQLLTIGDGNVPQWVPAGTDAQILTWESLPGSSQPNFAWTTPSALLGSDGLAPFVSSQVVHNGFGVIDDANLIGEAVDMLEGVVDRWQFVSAYSTTNVDLSTLMGPGEVVSQPDLSDGTVPIRGSDVRLFGQTNPAENGAYLVSNDGDTCPGRWTKYVDPDIFDPPGNGYRVTCNAPGTDGHGVTFMWIDDDRTKSRRVGSSTLSEASESGEWVRLATPSANLTSAPGGGDPAPSHTNFTSGEIYSLPGIVSNGTRAINASRATATPIVVKDDVTIDALQVDLSAAVASATTIDIHLFATANGYPTGAPVASASVTTTGTGTQTLLGATSGDVELAAGAYWAVIHNRAAATDHITARSVTSAQHLEPFPYAPGTNQVSCYLTNSGAVGTTAITAFPAVGVTTVQNQGPLVQFRVA